MGNSATFNNKYHFVYLNRSIEYLDRFSGGAYPCTDIEVETQAPYIPWQVRFLSDIHKNMRGHPLPAVRLKFLTAWDFYAMRYPALLGLLEKNNFSLESIKGRPGWIKESMLMEQDIKHFKRIGSGTDLSMDLTKRRK